MSTKTKQSSKIREGDLVTLNDNWQARIKPGHILRDISGIPDSFPSMSKWIGIVTNIRSGAGMPENNQYAQVLWENNRHAEHYIKDLSKVKQ